MFTYLFMGHCLSFKIFISQSYLLVETFSLGNICTLRNYGKFYKFGFISMIKYYQENLNRFNSKFVYVYYQLSFTCKASSVKLVCIHDRFLPTIPNWLLPETSRIWKSYPIDMYNNSCEFVISIQWKSSWNFHPMFISATHLTRKWLNLLPQSLVEAWKTNTKHDKVILYYFSGKVAYIYEYMCVLQTCNSLEPQRGTGGRN